MSADITLANAPVSYGVFELSDCTGVDLPGPEVHPDGD